MHNIKFIVHVSLFLLTLNGCSTFREVVQGCYFKSKYLFFIQDKRGNFVSLKMKHFSKIEVLTRYPVYK